MSGGDYHPVRSNLYTPVPYLTHRIGAAVLKQHMVSPAGFGDSLFEAFVTLSRHQLSMFLDQWSADLRRELATDSHGFLGKKYAPLSKKMHQTFPDLDILECYAATVTSESAGGNVDTARMWRREVNIAKIAQCCELFFGWGYKGLIIKRFQTFL